MKARKIALADYEVMLDVGGEEVAKTYKVVKSLVSILMGKDQNHTALSARTADKLATKIEEAKDEEVFLDAGEYKDLVGALNKVRGITRNDMKLVNAVFDAPEVELEEKVEEPEEAPRVEEPKEAPAE